MKMNMYTSLALRILPGIESRSALGRSLWVYSIPSRCLGTQWSCFILVVTLSNNHSLTPSKGQKTRQVAWMRLSLLTHCGMRSPPVVHEVWLAQRPSWSLAWIILPIAIVYGGILINENNNIYIRWMEYVEYSTYSVTWWLEYSVLHT